MKKIAFIFYLLLFSHLLSAQLKSVGFIAGGGGTIVNVDKVVEPYTLSNWNTWGMVIKGFAEFNIGDESVIGLEAGSNRLYYWEYQAPGYSWYNWRNEWTSNAVLYLSKSLGDKFYLQAGAGIHIFHTGTVAGLMAGAGRLFTVSEKLSLPVFFRIEPIFGKATPVAVNIGTGLRFNLKK